MQNLLYQYLATTRVDQFRYFDVIDSTNAVALEWVDAGAPDYSLVIADEQTQGRGRFERHWITKPGVSLAFSLILLPTDVEKKKIALFSPLCGLAVLEAVRVNLGLKPEIKWPNDVLLNRKKFSGILVEAAWTGGELAGIVLGIGINITPESIPSLNDKQYPATSLETEAGRKVDRFAILRDVLLAIQKWRGEISKPEFMGSWQDNLAFKGELVRIEHSEKPSIIGIVKGINHEGNLVLMTKDNIELSFEVGDVHLHPEPLSQNGENHVR